ncbi:MAG: S-layer homology domain-containing protein, partial [bacterium]
MSRQNFSSISVRALVWALIATIVAGPGLAQAQSWETDFGLYLVGSGNATELRNALSFTDLPTGSTAGAIVRLGAQGVLRGDGSGRFNPGTAVTREQALVALVRLLGWENLVQQAETG